MSENLVRQIVQSFESGDFRLLLEHVDENIVWKSAPRAATGLRFGGDHHGRGGVMEVTAHIAMAVTFHRLSPLELVSAGDTVWGLFDTVISRVGGPAKTLHYETALRFKFRNDRILELQSFFDTEQMRAFLAN